MTELVRYTPPASSLDTAPAAWKLAEKIHNTEAVPNALRGRPEAVLALMLVGHEAGISPMQSLTKIHIIEGRTGMSSELMRALALQHGHELEYVELSSTKVVARGRRRGAEKWTTIEYTIDDAKRAGLDQKGVWRKFPRQMLTARATGELCRLVFPDVLAGISYTMEELTDGHVSDEDAIVAEYVSTPAPATAPAGKTAKAKGGSIAREQPADDPAPPPPARGEAPPLPGEEDIVDADIVEDDPAPASAPAGENPPAAEEADDWPSGDWQTDPEAFPVDITADHAQKRYTGPQLLAIKLAERFGITGNSKEARRARLDAIKLFVGRPIESSKDLTPDEMSTLFATLQNLPAGTTLDEVAAERSGAEGTTGDAEESDAEDPSETEAAPVAPAAPEEVPDPPAATPVAEEPAPAQPRRRATPPPEEWTADAWRDLLAARKVKVTEAIAAAQKMAKNLDPKPSIATLEDIQGSGIAGELLGYVEDLALERRPAK